MPFDLQHAVNDDGSMTGSTRFAGSGNKFFHRKQWFPAATNFLQDLNPASNA
jgi:hypothetical protein